MATAFQIIILHCKIIELLVQEILPLERHNARNPKEGLRYNQDIDAGAGRVFFVTKQARCISNKKAQEVLLCNPSMAANFQVKYLIAIHQIKKCEPVEVSETQKVQSNAGSQTEKIQHNSESTQTHAPTNDATTTVQPRNVAIQTTDFIYDNQLVLELFALLIHRFCLKASNIYKSHRKLKSDVISRATATDLSFPVCLTRILAYPL
uniref:Uncharacterized protein n=1 Tax=Ditylenchus dipsaci TaxID=166011 RepID=A0A915D3Y2_9BILA